MHITMTEPHQAFAAGTPAVLLVGPRTSCHLHSALGRASHAPAHPLALSAGVQGEGGRMAVTLDAISYYLRPGMPSCSAGTC